MTNLAILYGVLLVLALIATYVLVWRADRKDRKRRKKFDVEYLDISDLFDPKK